MKKKKNHYKKYILIIILIAILCLIGMGIMEVQRRKNSEVTIVNASKDVEINTLIKIQDLSLTIQNGILLNGEDTLDTFTLGMKSVVLKLENEYGYEKETMINYTVVDTTAPIISNVKDVTVQKGGHFAPWAEVEVKDNSNELVTQLIEGEYNLQAIGNYPITYVAIDRSGNEARESATLKVVEKYVPDLTHVYIWEDQVITTSKGYQLEIINNVPYINDILIANKTYSIPPTYGNGLTAETLNAFNTMKSDAAALGLTLYNSSGFRSYSYQKSLYNNYCARRGQEKADTFSARPGFSEHQTGLALDLNTITQEFADTAEGKWVANNAQNYGFILRYPKGKEDETGYIYEPWHIRYVGVELAQELYNGGDWITLEDYFGIPSQYPDDYGLQ